MATPRVLHLSTYDAHGGAARAAYATHEALLAAGISSRMRVGASAHDDPTIKTNKKYPFMIAKDADRRLWSLQKTQTPTWRSPARFGSITAREINFSNADIVHLHWVTDGFASVETIGAIKKPIVWSLCDAWAFSGAEHYATDVSAVRSREGYTRDNRPSTDSGFDIDRWTWERKKKHWTTEMHLLPASTWLTENLRNSALMGNWPITQVPHIVNTNIFNSKNKREKQILLGIPSDRPVVLFLTSGGIHDRRKGWDLLARSLAPPNLDVPVTVVIVGPRPTLSEREAIGAHSPHKFVFFGEAHGDQQLSDLYSAADVTAVPSREDNMPISAMESQSCGTPVVAFNIGGLPDIVRHKVSGFLSQKENPQELAQGINWILKNDLRERARAHAIQTWSPESVTPKILEVYGEVLGGRSRSV